MDSSKKSFSALDHALNFSRSDNDVITVLHITPKGELNDALRDQINE
jgi:hypothetical protein